MHFNEAENRAIASRGGMNEKAVMRLLGSIPVALVPETVPSPDESELSGFSAKKLDIGMRLTGKDLPMQIERSALISLVSEALHEYSRVCPFVTAWVGRGDFDPKKLPERATSAVITHACRTAGRLRAKVMRKMSTRSTL
jgi:hypothetical protein